MSESIPQADLAVLDILRNQDTLTVSELAALFGVTPTTIRQRLGRLLAHGLIERRVERSGRGRPSHRYSITSKGRRKTGANFADLATVLWTELREVEDPEVRRGLLQRISKRLAEKYAGAIHGSTSEEKLESLAQLFAEREVPLEVGHEGATPVLNVLACPYPDLADGDHGVCAMEKLLFSELTGEQLVLDKCRLSGENYCSYELD